MHDGASSVQIQGSPAEDSREPESRAQASKEEQTPLAHYWQVATFDEHDEHAASQQRHGGCGGLSNHRASIIAMIPRAGAHTLRGQAPAQTASRADE